MYFRDTQSAKSTPDRWTAAMPGLDVLARGIERLRRFTLGETFWLLSCLRVILPLP